MTARNFSLPIVAPPTPGGPNWWQGIGGEPVFPARSWRTVGEAAPHVNVLYTPFLSMPGNLADSNIFNDYSGATVDQARREMLMVANGGHADYLGNEGYALALWADPPYWYRLNDPTPTTHIYTLRRSITAATNANPTVLTVGVGHNFRVGCNVGFAEGNWAAGGSYTITAVDSTTVTVARDATALPALGSGNIIGTSTYTPTGQAPSRYYDGRSSAMHTYGFQTYAKGKVWFSFQGHQTSPGGTFVNGLVAFNREFAGLPFSNAQPTLAWGDNAGPWTLLGPINNTPHGMSSASSNNWSGGTSVYDPVSECVYTICPQSPTFDYVKLNANTGAHNCYSQNSYGSPPPYVASRVTPCVIDDKALFSATNGVLGVFHHGSSTIHFVSIPKMGLAGQGTIWVAKTPTGTGPTPRSGGATVYHNGAIYYMDWTTYGSTIFKLTLPANLETGTPTWSIESDHNGNMGNGQPTPASVKALIPVGLMAGQGQWSKFNIVRDMGNGQAALVCASAYNGATSVYKIP